MKKIFPLIFLLTLTACGSVESAREVSRAGDYQPQGMTYAQFRNHMGDEDSLAAQKRFLALDRDNNGVLSPMERGGL